MICIQDPTYAESMLLHEALLQACSTAQYGAGAYAFVTADGVNLLMTDDMFSDFLKRGHYQLIVGMDDITNTRTLVALQAICDQYGDHLSPKALLHDTNGSTFHPKFSWFKCEQGGILVLGSGNLTHKGLRRNREAFVISEVDDREIAQIEVRWNSWIDSCHNYLKSIDDIDVVTKAKENENKNKMPKGTSHRGSQTVIEAAQLEKIELNDEADAWVFPSEMELNDEADAWVFSKEAEILITEIPGRLGGNKRWNQVIFDAETFRSYFGAQPGVTAQYRIVIRDVQKDGTLGEIKYRPAVLGIGKNYSMELSIPPGTQHPTYGRPLGVFAKISSRTFLYMFVFPGNQGYGALQDKVNMHRLRRDRLTQTTMTAEALNTLCPALPILSYLG